MGFKKWLPGIMLLPVLFTGAKAFSQTENDPVTEQIIESIAENVSENFDYSELTERLNFYRKYPLNLNKTNNGQLQEFYFLSPLQINAVLQHIEENGPLLNLLELQGIDGFDLPTIRKLLNFVKLNGPDPFIGISAANLLNQGRHDLILRYGQILENQQGFMIPDSSDRSRYLGTPQRFLTRYRYSFGQHIAASINMEKDAGEQFFAGSQTKGFDYYSASLSVKNVGKIRQLVAGDYALKFGQGLALWSGLSFGKGADIASITKQNIGLLPYTSFNEVLFFRGIAATLVYKNFAFTPFISFRKADAGLEDETAGINSLGLTGLHRTQNEISNKNAAKQLLFGSAVNYNYNALNIGATAYHSSFDKAFEAGRYLYNQFEFAGSKLTNFGLNYNYTLYNTYFFGEAAHSAGSGYAFTNGLISSISPKVSAVFLHRNYQKDYHSFYNQAISEGSTAVNERGFYSGLTVRPVSGWELSAYADFFRFPWLKYGVDAPSMGYELFGQLAYTPNKRLKVVTRYRYKQKEENDDDENTANMLQPVNKHNYRLELNYKINDDFMIRNRVEMSQYKKQPGAAETGYLAYQDVVYNPVQSKFSGNLRFSIFDTSGFNSRIYAYENDILYSYSVAGYQDSGLRYYVNGRYTLKKGIDVWARYSMTSYTDRQSIGSGLDEIAGNKRSDVRLQLRYQF